MSDVQDVIDNRSSVSWLSNYAERPAKLFSGAEVLLTIALSRKSSVQRIGTFTTPLRKWPTEFRASLFDTSVYFSAGNRIRGYAIPKISAEIEANAISSVMSKLGTLAEAFVRNSEHKIFYRIGGGRYWKIFTTFQPQFLLNGVPSVSSRESYLYFASKADRDIAVSLLSSTFFYWYFMLTTNGRDLNPSDLRAFPISPKKISTGGKQQLVDLSDQLMKSYRTHKATKEKTSKTTGNVVYEEFYPRMSKDTRTFRLVAALGAAQMLGWGSTYYLPAILADTMSADLGVTPITVFVAFGFALLVSALIGPLAGRWLDQCGGRKVMMGTSLLFSLGLASLGSSQGLVSLFAAWALIGIAMGSGLYDAAFASLVQVFGKQARASIVGISLLGGLASTIGWPLSSWIEATAMSRTQLQV